MNYGFTGYDWPKWTRSKTAQLGQEPGSQGLEEPGAK